MSFVVLISSIFAFIAGSGMTAVAFLIRSKNRTTCKNCVHRNAPECPFSHLEKVDSAELIYQRKTDRPDDFYCKEAQCIGAGAKRK